MEIQQKLDGELSRFLEELDYTKLNVLKESFKQNESGLSKGSFVNLLLDNFDMDYIESTALSIFNEINKDNSGQITWSQFLDYLLIILKPTYTKYLELGEHHYIVPPHVKRDAIAMVVQIETDAYFCYAIVTNFGRVGLYGGDLDFLTSYTVLMAREDVQRTDDERRRRNRWITDAVFVHQIQMFLVASSTRSLTIYDASGLRHVAVWLILGITDVVTSLTYIFDGKCRLCLGTEFGEGSVWSFQKPKDLLLRRKHNDKLTIFYYRELANEREFVKMRNLGRLHAESVINLENFHNRQMIISSSRDSASSVVIKDLENKRRPYVFKMRRGVNCFALSDSLKVLITGSDDGLVRVWNSLVPSNPLSILRRHKAGIVDLVIIETLNTFLSCSRDGIFKLWDLRELKCLQSIQLDFPCFQVMGKNIEWGKRCIFPGPKRNNTNKSDNKWERDYLLVICCNLVCKVNLIYLDNKPRDFDAAILSHPPLQNSVLIPKNWNIYNSEDGLDKVSEHDFVKYPVKLDKLQFILNKDILAKDGDKSDINYKIATLERKKMQMQWAVEKCAPYLALDLYQVKELELRNDLPAAINKKTKSLSEKTSKMLNEATTRSIILSSLSSSTSKSPRSSRSSIVEFDNVF